MTDRPDVYEYAVRCPDGTLTPYPRASAEVVAGWFDEKHNKIRCPLSHRVVRRTVGEWEPLS